nr:putative ribonuclease H-like domain-containing protein [Tanacetum cinerariifolium]
MTKTTHKQGFISSVYEEKTHEDLNTCLFACFLSQIEPTRVTKALSDLAWAEAMHEELLQFKLQKVWILVDLPKVSTASPEATHADFLGDKPDEDMSNINTTYQVPSTPHIRIHKDHLLDLVIGDVQSSVLTRKMTKTTHKQGFISSVYEEKTHEDL